LYVPPSVNFSMGGEEAVVVVKVELGEGLLLLLTYWWSDCQKYYYF
jgi:hypothetical protein